MHYNSEHYRIQTHTTISLAGKEMHFIVHASKKGGMSSNSSVTMDKSQEEVIFDLRIYDYLGL